MLLNRKLHKLINWTNSIFLKYKTNIRMSELNEQISSFEENGKNVIFCVEAKKRLDRFLQPFCKEVLGTKSCSNLLKVEIALTISK